uniref:Thiolase_N domain-containing protein n=1 Tax=Macrostomum lignano TaxID=282301 RepID=A0A1I8IL57_9PLAT
CRFGDLLTVRPDVRGLWLAALQRQQRVFNGHCGLCHLAALSRLAWVPGQGRIAIVKFKRPEGRIAIVKFKRPEGRIAIVKFKRTEGRIAITRGRIAIVKFKRPEGRIAIVKFKRPEGRIAIVKFKRTEGRIERLRGPSLPSHDLTRGLTLSLISSACSLSKSSSLTAIRCATMPLTITEHESAKYTVNFPFAELFERGQKLLRSGGRHQGGLVSLLAVSWIVRGQAQQGLDHPAQHADVQLLGRFCHSRVLAVDAAGHFNRVHSCSGSSLPVFSTDCSRVVHVSRMFCRLMTPLATPFSPISRIFSWRISFSTREDTALIVFFSGNSAPSSARCRANSVTQVSFQIQHHVAAERVGLLVQQGLKLAQLAENLGGVLGGQQLLESGGAVTEGGGAGRSFSCSPVTSSRSLVRFFLLLSSLTRRWPTNTSTFSRQVSTRACTLARSSVSRSDSRRRNGRPDAARLSRPRAASRPLQFVQTVVLAQQVGRPLRLLQRFPELLLRSPRLTADLPVAAVECSLRHHFIVQTLHLGGHLRQQQVVAAAQGRQQLAALDALDGHLANELVKHDVVHVLLALHQVQQPVHLGRARHLEFFINSDAGQHLVEGLRQLQHLPATVSGRRASLGSPPCACSLRRCCFCLRACSRTSEGSSVAVAVALASSDFTALGASYRNEMSLRISQDFIIDIHFGAAALNFVPHAMATHLPAPHTQIVESCARPRHRRWQIGADKIRRLSEGENHLVWQVVIWGLARLLLLLLVLVLPSRIRTRRIPRSNPPEAVFKIFVVPVPVQSKLVVVRAAPEVGVVQPVPQRGAAVPVLPAGHVGRWRPGPGPAGIDRRRSEDDRLRLRLDEAAGGRTGARGPPRRDRLPAHQILVDVSDDERWTTVDANRSCQCRGRLRRFAPAPSQSSFLGFKVVAGSAQGGGRGGGGVAAWRAAAHDGRQGLPAVAGARASEAAASQSPGRSHRRVQVIVVIVVGVEVSGGQVSLLNDGSGAELEAWPGAEEVDGADQLRLPAAAVDGAAAGESCRGAAGRVEKIPGAGVKVGEQAAAKVDIRDLAQLHCHWQLVQHLQDVLGIRCWPKQLLEDESLVQAERECRVNQASPLCLAEHFHGEVERVPVGQPGAWRGHRLDADLHGALESSRRHGASVELESKFFEAALSKSGVFIVAAKRTPFGAFGGALKDHSATDLAETAARAALEASGAPKDAIGSVVFGNPPGHCHAVAPRGRPPRPADLTPAFNVNRLCGSGFQSVVSATNEILLGDSEVSIAGGSESMSGTPYAVWGVRFGTKFGTDYELTDLLWHGLIDKQIKTPMGVTAENLAEKFQLTRKECDEFAVVSQDRWQKANADGAFKAEIVPMQVKGKKGPTEFAVDEHPRAATVETMAKLPPVFKKNGVVHAGNASGICDGAAALVLASEAALKRHSLKPLAA